MAKFKVGDIVVVKTWDEMEWEFEKDPFGAIKTYHGFPADMKRFCGNAAEITGIDKHDVDLAFFDKELARFSREWNFDTDMITIERDEAMDIPDESELLGFVGGVT